MFIVEQGLSVFVIRYGRAIFSLKHFRGTFAASFLQFIQVLVRLSRNVGAEPSKSDDRNADGCLHVQSPIVSHMEQTEGSDGDWQGQTSILPPAKRIELVTKVKCATVIGRCLGAIWKKPVSSCLHTNVHEGGLNFQICFR